MGLFQNLHLNLINGARNIGQNFSLASAQLNQNEPPPKVSVRQLSMKM